MSRQFKNGKCSCWKKVDKRLAEHNTKLSQSFTFTGEEFLVVETCKINNDKRGRPKRVFASHCPFCGAKLESGEAS